MQACSNFLLCLEHFAQLNAFKTQPCRVFFVLRTMHTALLSIHSSIVFWNASISSLCYQCYEEHGYIMSWFNLGFLVLSMEVVAGSVVILCFTLKDLPDYSEVTAIFYSHQWCTIVLLLPHSCYSFYFF